MNFGEIIKSTREENNLSQEELAEKLLVSRQTISNWENNKTLPDFESVILFSKLYDVSLDFIIKGDENMRRNIKVHNRMRDLIDEAITKFGALLAFSGLFFSWTGNIYRMIFCIVAFIIGFGMLYKNEKLSDRIYDFVIERKTREKNTN